jgi:predicted RND superfamily exporter protein
LGGLQLDSKIPIETNQDSFVPPDMPAKMARDTVTRTVGVTDPAPLILTGDVTSLDTIRWMKEFTDHELSVHTPGIHRALSIADYVLAYNNGTMPEIQSDLNNVLTKIPLDIKKQYLNGHIEAVVLFYLNKMNTKAKDDLKRQMYGDLMMNPPPPGIRYSITEDLTCLLPS